MKGLSVVASSVVVGVVVILVVNVTLLTSSVSAYPYFNVEADTETLQLVQVIVRHGDRAPTNTYPNDPVNDDPQAWPEGRAQLTSVRQFCSILFVSILVKTDYISWYRLEKCNNTTWESI